MIPLSTSFGPVAPREGVRCGVLVRTTTPTRPRRAHMTFDRPQRRRSKLAGLSIGLPDLEADDGSRTRDLWLGKPTLYQLSYVREEGGF